MNLDAYYQLKNDPQQFPATLRLRFNEWDVLLKLNGERTLAHLGTQLGLDEVQMREMVNKFLKQELIERADMSFTEYLNRKQRIASGHPAQEHTGHTPKVVERTVVPAPFSLPPLVPVDAAFAPLPVLPIPTPTTVEPKPVAAKSVAPSRQLSLKALMDFIMNQAGGDSNAGQLMIYRVFMRVETKLLKRNGINSLRFQEDRLVADTELENALMQSVSQALGVDCPADVFVG